VRAVYVSAGRPQWTETCRAVSQLRSLRSFVLVLESNWFSEPVEKLAGFLGPLSGVVVRSGSGLRRGWDRDSGGKKDDVDVDVDVDVELGVSDGFSSDEDSCKSLGSDSSFSSVGVYNSTAATTATATAVASGSRGSWELRLQGQCYYLHELDRIGVDLRRRGIDCWISAV
jgi:hypothetical protein